MHRLTRAAIGLAALLPAVASAQSGIDGRVGKLESEMRAVQRKVFPGGAGAYLQPEITAPATPVEAPGTPASSALADLNGRVASLEQQMTTLTGQTEENDHRVRELQSQFDAYRRDMDARIKSLEGGAAAPAVVAGAVEEPSAQSAPPPVRPRPARPTAPVATKTADAPPVDAPADDLGAVARPVTGDGAEDGYLYGYRLWQAKQYPQAEAQLKKVVAQYPKSRRASFAQNLLGRTYLDEGKPSLASMAFYDNYKKMPDGERAPDSLYYLAQALVTLKKPADACKVYDELTDVYGAKISAGMKADVAKGRTVAKCR